MRLLALLTFLLLSVAASFAGGPNPVLVLVQPGVFDPIVNPDAFFHPYWVRWSASTQPDRGNRLLSVATGLDWLGEPADEAFDEVPGQGGWRSRNYGSLQERGYFRAQARLLPGVATALLLNRTGGTRREALLLTLGWQGSTVHGYRTVDPWPEGRVMVVAGNGDDLQAVRGEGTGRILVVEYPPRAGQSWSRLWLMGKGWPEGLMTDHELGVPGLTPAEKLLPLLSDPASFTWKERADGWLGANRWLAFLSAARPYVLGFVGLLAAVLFVAGGFLVSQEKRSPLLVAGLRLLALAPAAMVLGGALARVGGLNGGYVWIGVSWLALAGAAAMIDARTGSSRWIGSASLTLAVVTLFDPTFSVLGTVLQSGPISVPGELLGVALASFVLVAAALRNQGRPGEIGTLMGAGLLAGGGIPVSAWWVRDGWILAAWWVIVAGIALVRLPGRTWLLAGLVTPGLADLLFRGVAFSPNGLLSSDRNWHRLNLYEHLRFVVSPAVLGTLFLMAMGAVFGSGFFAHQLRLAWRQRPEARALVTAGGACGLGGLTYPPLLHAGLICLFASGIVLFDWLLRPVAPL